MTNIILLNEADNVIYRFKKMALKVLKTDEKKIFIKHFDSYIEWLGDEKKDFADAVKTLSVGGGPAIVHNMLDMFKIKEEEQNAKMGSSIEHSGGDGSSDPVLSGLCASGSESGDGDPEPASEIPLRGSADLASVPD